MNFGVGKNWLVISWNVQFVMYVLADTKLIEMQLCKHLYAMCQLKNMHS